MKDKLILFGWITGLLLLISVVLFFSQPALAFNLLRSVNNVFENKNDSRRLSVYLPVKTGKAEIFGFWYTMYNSSNKMFVFTAFQDGILVPLGAVVSSNGNVDEVLPLSAHAEQIFDAMPKSVLQMYIYRIQDAAHINFSASGGTRR
jgi:hypothetical protein